jgi:hypothetical protein
LILHRIAGAEEKKGLSAGQSATEIQQVRVRQTLESVAASVDYAFRSRKLPGELGIIFGLLLEFFPKKAVATITGICFFFYRAKSLWTRRILPPVVLRVRKSLIHHRIEASLLFDEDFREGAVLAEQNSLEADEFKESQEDSHKRPLGSGVAE